MSGLITNGPLKVGLGWLDGTAATPVPDEVTTVVQQTFGRSFDMAPVGYYGSRMGFDSGRVSVSWNGRANAKGTTRVEVTQTALDGLGLDGGVAFLRSLTAVGYRPSRLDEWMDDPERRMTPARVRAAVLAGQVVTHARPGVDMFDDLDQRETYYLGRPGSDRRVRCYMRPESEDVRYELQSRRAAARHSAAVVLAAADPVAAVVSNVVSFADYRQSHARADGRRAPRLAWWSAVVGDVASAEGAPSRPRPSLAEREAYFRDHWSRALAELYMALGPEWLNSILREGSRRMDEVEVAS